MMSIKTSRGLRRLNMNTFRSLYTFYKQSMEPHVNRSGNNSVDVFLDDQALNTSNNSSLNFMDYGHRWETYIVPILFGLIFVLGLLGNGTLIRIFYSNQSMRTKPNTFILCLAVGDLMVMIGAIPFISFIYTLESWPFGTLFCKASEFFRDLSTGVTVFTLAILSVDRYLAVSSPYIVASDTSKGMAVKVMIVVIWSMSIFFALPAACLSFVMKVDITDDRSISICYPFPQSFGPTYPIVVVTLKFFIYYALPIIVISFYYTLIVSVLLREPVAAPGHERRRKERVKVVKMVLVLVTVFIICYLPNYLFLLWFYYTFPNSMSNYNTFWHILKILGYVLSFSNSCLNPLILYFISKKYRVHFQSYLCCIPASRQHLQRKAVVKLPPGAVRYIFKVNPAMSS